MKRLVQEGKDVDPMHWAGIGGRGAPTRAEALVRRERNHLHFLHDNLQCLHPKCSPLTPRLAELELLRRGHNRTTGCVSYISCEEGGGGRREGERRRSCFSASRDDASPHFLHDSLRFLHPNPNSICQNVYTLENKQYRHVMTVHQSEKCIRKSTAEKNYNVPLSCF